MKKLFLIGFAASLILLNTRLHAQNALQFSRVVTLAASNITTTPHTIGVVPAGKVWKVEHMAGHRGGNAPSFAFYIDGLQTEAFYSINMTSYYYPNQYPKGVVWLKAGDELRFLYCSGSNVGYYFISIIEFTVVPTP